VNSNFLGRPIITLRPQIHPYAETPRLGVHDTRNYAIPGSLPASWVECIGTMYSNRFSLLVGIAKSHPEISGLPSRLKIQNSSATASPQYPQTQPFLIPHPIPPNELFRSLWNQRLFFKPIFRRCKRSTIQQQETPFYIYPIIKEVVSRC
jgi:hypothetical protein